MSNVVLKQEEALMCLKTLKTLSTRNSQTGNLETIKSHTDKPPISVPSVTSAPGLSLSVSVSVSLCLSLSRSLLLSKVNQILLTNPISVPYVVYLIYQSTHLSHQIYVLSLSLSLSKVIRAYTYVLIIYLYIYIMF